MNWYWQLFCNKHGKKRTAYAKAESEEAVKPLLTQYAAERGWTPRASWVVCLSESSPTEDERVEGLLWLNDYIVRRDADV